ncbi:hypothetical protein P5V15_004525, partial [Pogonomyrmex californicus]
MNRVRSVALIRNSFFFIHGIKNKETQSSPMGAQTKIKFTGRYGYESNASIKGTFAKLCIEHEKFPRRARIFCLLLTFLMFFFLCIFVRMHLKDYFCFRPLLKQIKNSAESHIVLDCSTERIYDVLKQAQQIGMMSDYHSYLITSLDLHTVDLEEFKHGGTNITAFRLVDPEKPEIQKTETSLLYDAVHLFAKALHDLDTSQQIDIKPLSCESTDTWPHGYSLINYMKI